MSRQVDLQPDVQTKGGNTIPGIREPALRPRLNILFVCMGIPSPPDTGKRLSNWAFLRSLVLDGHRVTLVTFSEPADLASAAETLADVCNEWECIPLSPTHALGSVRSLFARLITLGRAVPFSASRFRSDSMRACLKRRMTEGHFDLVVFDEIFTLQNIPPGFAVPVLLKKDHIATLILERYLDHEPGILKRTYARFEHWRMSRWENDMIRKATGVMACSQLEADLLEKMCPGIPMTVVPNVIDVSNYAMEQNPLKPSILYTGTMDWYPNQDAADYFVRHILPVVARAIPNVEFVIAGRATSHKLRQKYEAIPGVRFLGTVPDMRPVIAKSAVCVVPLRIASGTRLKILEAAAMGKPVVSTTIGAEGLEFVDGKEIFIADDAVAFAEAVIRLLQSAELRHDTGLAARKKVESFYSLEALQSAVRVSISPFENARRQNG